MGENTQEIPKGKAYQQCFESTENKAEVIDQFKQYIQQKNARAKLKRSVIFKTKYTL